MLKYYENSASFETLKCEKCGELIGFGSGDLNCCIFLCPSCVHPEDTYESREDNWI